VQPAARRYDVRNKPDENNYENDKNSKENILNKEEVIKILNNFITSPLILKVNDYQVLKNEDISITLLNGSQGFPLETHTCHILRHSY
jgi:hypothetical protein